MITDAILRQPLREGALSVGPDREDAMKAFIPQLARETDTLPGAGNGDADEVPTASVTGKAFGSEVEFGMSRVVFGLDEASGRSPVEKAPTRVTFRRNPSLSNRSSRTGAMPLQRCCPAIEDGRGVDASRETRKPNLVSEVTAMPALHPWF